MTEKKKLRFGILSTATIARKNWQAMRNSGNCELVAVASRDKAKSQAYIDENQFNAPFPTAPRALGSYDELIADPNIDAVYIPLPTGLRKEWVIKAADAGKHIVCEKPCGTSLENLQEMVEACRTNKVQFMDGVMFMHSGRLAKIREALADESNVGTIRRLASQFSFCAPEDFLTGNIRMHSGLEPHGCLGDLGWYPIRFFLWLMNWQMPKSVTGRMLTSQGRADSPDSVPLEFSGELFFDGGVSASFYCSFITENQQWMNVSGTKGYLRMDDFVLPFFGAETAFEITNLFFNVKGCEFNMENHTRRFAVPEYSNSTENSQETNLYRNFANQVLSGSLNEDWPDFALKTQTVMEACLKSAREGSGETEV